MNGVLAFRDAIVNSNPVERKLPIWSVCVNGVEHIWRKSCLNVCLSGSDRDALALARESKVNLKVRDNISINNSPQQPTNYA